jgi:hypothetical protein
MFTIFEEENEPLSERAKVDELLTKVQHTALAAAVAQLHFQLNTEGLLSLWRQTISIRPYLRLKTIKLQERSHLPIPMRDSQEVALVEAMDSLTRTVAGMAEVAGAVAVVVAAAHLETRAARAV